MNTSPSQVEKKEKEKKRRAILPLLLLLLFLLMATSCIVGFLLGRTTEPGRFGILIDTIVLSPEGKEPTPSEPPAVRPTAGPAEEPTVRPTAQPTTPPSVPAAGEAGGETAADISLLGTVRYTDGTIFARGSVELRSVPRVTALDGEGRFRFDRVAVGSHTLTVLDWAGKTLASREFRVDRDDIEDAYMEYEEEVCVLHIKLLTVEVDVEVTLDESLEKLDIQLAGDREGGTAPTAPPVTTPTSTPTVTATPSAVPTPSSAPSAAPSGTPAAAPAGVPSMMPSVAPTASPTVTPTARPSEGPSAMPTPTPTSAPSGLPTASPSVPPPPSDHLTPTATPTSRPTPEGSTDVFHGDSGVSWTQQAEIDLFRPLDGSGDRQIAPGSEGYYLFRLENGRKSTVRFTLAIQEGRFHVPLEYRITDGETPSVVYSPWQTASVTEETVSEGLELAGGTDGYYRIQWRWPFLGDDATDTALGRRDDRIYTLRLTIRAEEVEA